MTSRTIAGMSAYASVVTSPATCTCPVVTRVSTATRDRGSLASNASRIESLIASQILSGWPSVTDSDVNSRDDTACWLDPLTTHPPLAQGILEVDFLDRVLTRPGRRSIGEQRDHRVPHLGRHVRLGAQLDRPFGAVDRQQPPGVVLHLEGLALADRVHNQ